MRKLLHIDADGGIGVRQKPIVLSSEGNKSLEEIRALYGLSTPITKENVETVVMLLSNEIASSHTIFNKSNSQAAVHAVLLFQDLLIGNST